MTDVMQLVDALIEAGLDEEDIEQKAARLLRKHRQRVFDPDDEVAARNARAIDRIKKLPSVQRVWNARHAQRGDEYMRTMESELDEFLWRKPETDKRTGSFKLQDQPATDSGERVRDRIARRQRERQGTN